MTRVATVATFDSGVGGLSVFRHVVAMLPGTNHLYLADQAFAPYGERSLEAVRGRTLAAVQFLIAQGADEVVVACNTASAAGLHPARAEFPDIPIVGMEPAVKPATQATRSGVIGVLATEATFQGELYRSLVDQYGPAVEIVQLTGRGLAELVEQTLLDGPEVEAALAPHAEVIVHRRADVLVLGCTHYPFLAPVLTRLLGNGVTLIDPSPAVARQAVRRFPGPVGRGPGTVRYLTTGPAERLAAQLGRLLGDPQAAVEQVVVSAPAAP